jgi:DNA-directed RNA polymerase II subunit RPB1
VLP